MSANIISFVMSGGIGSRLWPLSREDNPKQFHDFSGEGSMLASTVRRLSARPGGPAPVWLIASARHVERVRADLADAALNGGRTIYEPVGRNTAVAVAVAALTTLQNHGDALVLVVPSDHEISTDAQFWQSVEAGVPAAQNGDIVVFGIAPDRPETGFGYIEIAPDARRDAVARVSRFVEKPDLATAEKYVKAGNFFWNAGIFLFSAAAMRDAFIAHAPDIWTAAEKALTHADSDATGVHIRMGDYETIRSISVDYAIVEHAKAISMVPATFRWSDLGSWQSLLESGRADERGNVIQGDVVAIDCDNAYLRSEGRLLTAIGLRSVAVVSTMDATFVAPVSESQNVKKIVEKLEKSGRLETRVTPAHDRMPVAGSWRKRIHHWLFEETLPLWSTEGVDHVHGGFHETLSFDGKPVHGARRMRTMARQIYAFAVAKERGWDGPADALIAHGVDFIDTRGRARGGGWAKVFNADGSVLDDTPDT
nr:sugar phosphate nucleotidyltransferase [Rhizobiaceae bacterium]